MGTFRRYAVQTRHAVQTVLRRARQERTALLLFAGATALVVVGYTWPRSQTDLVAAAEPHGSVSTINQPEQQDGGRLGSRVAVAAVFYAAPDAEVLAGFLASGPRGSGEQVFVPAEIPAGSRIVPRPAASGDSSKAIAGGGPTVVLATNGGYLAFYDALDGSLTHLPGAPCGMVGGRPAIVRRVLGGELVTWEVAGASHAVFGWGVSRSVVVRVASSVRPWNAVDR